MIKATDIETLQKNKATIYGVTEDNYSKVLEKCVELFLGEKYEP